MARKVPEIPSASLADIAFMLLIFFLVTTTMDVDSGLRRKLPPFVPEQQDDTPPIKKRNIFEVLVNKDNMLLVEGDICRLEDLRGKAKEFLNPNLEGENLPEKKTEYVEFFGDTKVLTGSAVISLRNDLDTKYGVYLAVQNELIAAINDLRNDLAKKKFGKLFESLESEQQKAIKKIYPQKISEAEPKKVGGK
ncbi:biopolymer transporter ExbD [Prolixibacteraceae bacterium JC049]|nr:biopolymer transporter ExbD [Prolixibacteraceae bacterium JC049]